MSNFGNGTINQVTPNGTISTFATGFSFPVGLAFSTSGDLFAVNSGDNTVKRVTSGGNVSTFATGFNSPRFLTFAPSAVSAPEHGSIALLGIGFAGMAGIVARRKHCPCN